MPGIDAAKTVADGLAAYARDQVDVPRLGAFCLPNCGRVAHQAFRGCDVFVVTCDGSDRGVEGVSVRSS